MDKMVFKMNVLDFVVRQKEMLRIFRMNKDIERQGTEPDIRFFKFESSYNFKMASDVSHCALVDGSITENLQFTYPVFFPKSRNNLNEAIVLLHGLNERNWDKYLCWAEYLAIHTGKPVILFPIAYHMNRSPMLWSDPRCMSLLVRKRQQLSMDSQSLSFANVALSERLSEDPARFYTSGRQTVEDLHHLANNLFLGNLPFFEQGTKVDFFAYSIGAFLAEILLMANPGALFEHSRLFIFCGGSIFSSMAGESKLIMDKKSYDRLMDFYQHQWITQEESSQDKVDEERLAFDAMISPQVHREKREHFFRKLGQRILGISLKKDQVMPFEGVQACMGNQHADQRFELLDFPYDYSHEAPFPSSERISPDVLNACFNQVFSKAALFLA